MFGKSWDAVKKLHVDHLGIALLDEHLRIVTDTVVSLTDDNGGLMAELKRPEHHFTKNANLLDYRLVTMHNQVYLSWSLNIVPLYLSFDNNNEYSNNDMVRLRTVFDTSTTTLPELAVSIRRYSSCPELLKPEAKLAKNFLYFVDGNNQTVLDFYPASVPHAILPVDLVGVC